MGCREEGWKVGGGRAIGSGRHTPSYKEYAVERYGASLPGLGNSRRLNTYGAKRHPLVKPENWQVCALKGFALPRTSSALVASRPRFLSCTANIGHFARFSPSFRPIPPGWMACDSTLSGLLARIDVSSQ